MKLRTLLVAAAAITFGACSAPAPEYFPAQITGSVSGVDKPVGLYGVGGQLMTELDEHGQFSFAQDSVKEGFYTLSVGNDLRQSIYLAHNTQLNLEIDVAKLRRFEASAVVLSGENIEENLILNQQRLNKPRSKMSADEYKQAHAEKLYQKTPAAYEAYTNGLLEGDLALLKDYADLSENFVEVYTVEAYLNYQRNFQNYDNSRRYYAPENTAVVPARFKNYYGEQIPKEDWNLYGKSNQYEMYVRGKYSSNIEKELKQYTRESLDWHKGKMAYLDTCGFPDVIKKGMYDGLTISYMRTRDPEVKAYLKAQIKQHVTDEASLERFAEWTANEVKNQEGTMATNFTYTDIDGNEVSLSDFKGKMVYIDLWATWCVPCLRGIPYFHALKDQYQDEDIVFMSISLDENVEAWEKKPKDNPGGNFDGLQLKAGAYKTAVSNDYGVNGIPHYILIGADGRVIKKSAPRPETDEIKTLIEQHL